jgi:hypothetical protein
VCTLWVQPFLALWIWGQYITLYTIVLNENGEEENWEGECVDDFILGLKDTSKERANVQWQCLCPIANAMGHISKQASITLFKSPRAPHHHLLESLISDNHN